MISEIKNSFNSEPSVIVRDIQLNHPRVKIEKIRELKKLDPTLAIYTKLVNIFEVEVSTRIPEMKNFCHTEDFKNLSCVIHRFKSTTYNLGASRAVELTKALETAILQQARQVEMKQLIAVLEEECLDTHEELLTYLVKT